MDVGKRIKRRREALGLSQQQLAIKLGYKDRSTVNRWEKDGNGLRPKKLVEIAKALDCDIGYFLNNAENNVIPVNTKDIPVVGEVACGLPIFAEQNIIGYAPIDKKDNVDFALYARGDSMTAARINDGDLVFIRQQSTVENGEIALVLVNGETATIKRFYDYGDFVELRPSSFNPEHQTQTLYKKENDIAIQGKVVFIKAYVK